MVQTTFDLGAMLTAPTSAVQQILCDKLIPYHNHKFELYTGERLDDMVASVKPIIIQAYQVNEPCRNGEFREKCL